MPINKIESPHFTYIVYTRQSFADTDQLKRELNSIAARADDIKDVVLDFGGLNTIASVEIGSVVRLLGHLKGKGRYVRVILNQRIKQVFVTTNLVNLEGLAFYDSRESFSEQLKHTIPAEHDPENKG